GDTAVRVARVSDPLVSTSCGNELSTTSRKPEVPQMAHASQTNPWGARASRPSIPASRRNPITDAATMSPARIEIERDRNTTPYETPFPAGRRKQQAGRLCSPSLCGRAFQFICALAITSTTFAADLPNIRLDAISPPGAKAGTEFQASVNGA